AWIDAEDVERDGVSHHLSGVDGILVPGGFGARGIEGKIAAIRYAREQKIPFFGICLGMQCAVIEFARDVCGIKGANSTEFDKDAQDPLIYLMTEWFDYRKNAVQTRNADSDLGGTMRLGAYPCVLQEGSRSHEAYGAREISERHRHRYEFNNLYRERLAAAGLKFSGLSPDGELVEIVELENHPWYVACQFHPEFKSKPTNPHPLFVGFVKAAVEATVKV
ncbi:MAG: gamma-glutamyl-gamma-aminobutyrate hydrolase family protein, partial [Nitrospirota bacterium]|nr:gamma-glutamyl-gamma-aminobutyrate hydrolase family protein [Nitrospirota bacterium]